MAIVARNLRRILIPPRVEFSWSPISAPASITVNGNTYPYQHQEDGLTRDNDLRYAADTALTNTLLTFVADVTTFNDAFVVRYHWDFGDGTEGYGPTVTKTYYAPNPTTTVRLFVTDSNNKSTSVSHTLSLLVNIPSRVKFTRH